MADAAGESPEQLRQLRELLGAYNRLAEDCFAACVTDMSGREPAPSELLCSERCLQKYLRMRQRTTARFQELLLRKNEPLQAAKHGVPPPLLPR